MEFYANDGPFSGRDGKFVTITQLRERLYREQQINVGLKVEDIPGQAGRLVGETTEGVLRKAPCPVIIVPHPKISRSRPPWPEKPAGSRSPY